MRKGFLKLGLAAGVLLGLGLGGASAAAMRPVAPESLGLGAAAEPVAMCGYSCRSGGRYIPGPPSVCYEQGLNYCGPSRGWGGPPPGRRFYGGHGGYGGGPYGPPRGYGPPQGYGPPRAYGPPAGPPPGRTWYGYGPGRCGWSLC